MLCSPHGWLKSRIILSLASRVVCVVEQGRFPVFSCKDHNIVPFRHHQTASLQQKWQARVNRLLLLHQHPQE